MKVGQIIGAVLDTVVKIVIIGVIVSYTYKYALEAYDFGYQVFAEEPVSSPEAAKVISIYIPESATAMEVGEVLEEKGLIRDARLFLIQELLSGHHDELREGSYELSSDMTSEEMIKVLTAEPSEDEEEDTSGKAAEDGKEDGSDSPEEASEGGEEAPEEGTEAPDGGGTAEDGQT